MGRLIYFFGVDGVGKTTHAALLDQYIACSGQRTTRATVKQHHTFAFVLLTLFRMMGLIDRRGFYHGFGDEFSSKIRPIWRWLELLSIIPPIVLRVYLPMILGYVVICDRFVIDTAVSVSYFLRERSERLVYILLSLIPKRSTLILLDADPLVIMRRRSDEPITVELVRFSRSMYRELSRRVTCEVLALNTTDLSTSEVQNTVRRFVSEIPC